MSRAARAIVAMSSQAAPPVDEIKKMAQTRETEARDSFMTKRLEPILEKKNGSHFHGNGQCRRRWKVWEASKCEVKRTGKDGRPDRS
jgi:hypothetical protein